ncbi:MAG: hypothetical protein MZU97_01565 [Bacillus subtilis]|nr:hypothetical protein [Bacillus subtilis]
MLSGDARAGHGDLFSTHVLDVAEKICNKVAILIKQGRIVASGTTAEVDEGPVAREPASGFRWKGWARSSRFCGPCSASITRRGGCWGSKRLLIEGQGDRPRGRGRLRPGRDVLRPST